MRRRSAIASAPLPIGRPSTRPSPEVADAMPISMRIVVVLPAPLRPRKP
jgi:hypothetical protein